MARVFVVEPVSCLVDLAAMLPLGNECPNCDGEEIVCATGCQGGNSPAGAGAGIDDLVFSFFYNLRDAEGNLIDKINIPPAKPGRGISFVMGRGQGFDTGVAILVTQPQMVNVKVYLPVGVSPLGIPGVDVLESNFQMDLFRDDFFLSEVVPDLREEIPAALVEMTVGSGQMYGVVLGVQVEGSTLQVSGQNVNVIDPIR